MLKCLKIACLFHTMSAMSDTLLPFTCTEEKHFKHTEYGHSLNLFRVVKDCAFRDYVAFLRIDT